MRCMNGNGCISDVVHFYWYIFHHLKCITLSISLLNETTEITLPVLLQGKAGNEASWDSCGDAEIIVSEGRSVEAEFLIYYVILTTRLVPDKNKTFGCPGIVQCLAFSLSCINTIPASASGRSFETGVFLYFLPIINICPSVLKILDSFWSILGQKGLCSSKLKMVEKWHHHSSFPEVFSCLSDISVDLKRLLLTLLLFGKVCYLLWIIPELGNSVNFFSGIFDSPNQKVIIKECSRSHHSVKSSGRSSVSQYQCQRFRLRGARLIKAGGFPLFYALYCHFKKDTFSPFAFTKYKSNNCKAAKWHSFPPFFFLPFFFFLFFPWEEET